ncbi:MAG: Rieske (2Fe-2S) protein, partial [Intrasporangium sp.]|uniref:Rieske (2Fe-2S) protein n=1 Tax=Intrasporangium sp. TaxID=1925024 RepID=UPI003F81DF05
MTLRRLRTDTSRSGHAAAPVPRPPGRRLNPLQVMPEVPRTHLAETWRDARPARIRRAFLASQQRDPGGWHVLGASTELGTGRSRTRTVGGREVVLWRTGDGTLLAGPGTCPHLGALL